MNNYRKSLGTYLLIHAKSDEIIHLEESDNKETLIKKYKGIRLKKGQSKSILFRDKFIGDILIQYELKQ